MTADYLDALEAALSFDRSLARRVRQEFEDHLQQALAADRCENRSEAERRAIAGCGDPLAIAAEFAEISVVDHTRKLAFWIVLVLLGVLGAMKGHIAWYAVMQWGVPEGLRSVASTVGAVARYAFWTAIFAGSAGWAYGSWRRLPVPGVVGRNSPHFRRFCLLSGVTSAALAASILSDAVLAVIRLGRLSATVALLIPIASILFEIGCAAGLILLVRAVVRRAAFAAALQKA